MSGRTRFVAASRSGSHIGVDEAMATARKKARRASGAGRVSVRMYRGLLGDFFLVRHVQGDSIFKMLIDCGVLQRIGTVEKKPSTSRGKERIALGVADMLQEVGGELDLVVATHEHYDHLSGFLIANAEFANLTIRELWLAWTEDRSDSVARKYRNEKRKALTALTALAGNAALASSAMETVRNLLQFYGYGENTDEEIEALGLLSGTSEADLGADAGKLRGNASCEAVISWLKARATPRNVRYLRPGQVVRWGVDGGLRGYVLGPPRDDERLRRLNPSSAEGEVYLARSEDVATVMGLAALHGGAAADDGVEQPFAGTYHRYFSGHHPKGARQAPESDPLVRLYRDTPKDRLIDEAWHDSAEALALKIDGDVNNTSLVLALELNTDDRQNLLFAADAQVGNWLSWGDQTYPATDAESAPHITIAEVLANTVLYKVGHHASHNATLQDNGLELMVHPELCAMIPVVEETAREQATRNVPDGWAMPYDKLYAALRKTTRGRIVRGDGDVKAERTAFKGSLFKLDHGPDVVKGDPLWVELGITAD